MNTINELITAVQQNAKDHGWWDDERKYPELLALIHSEWSEALEEARAGRPMVWFACNEDVDHTHVCQPKDETDCLNYGKEDACQWRGHKPEGIAVELIDGCIRILDVFGRISVECTDPETGTDSEISSLWEDTEIEDSLPDSLPELVCYLHSFTSKCAIMDMDPQYLMYAMSTAMTWIKHEGYDPLALLMAKHEYNKTRPYKHGKKF